MTPYRYFYDLDKQRYVLCRGNLIVRVFRRGTTLKHVEEVLENYAVSWFRRQKAIL